jgi:ABC-type antimicrobial peptide transport system permease subunit
MLALLIACIGLYSTVAYQTVRRTNEIGVRVALGATRSGVIWLLVRSVLVVQAVGLCLGIPAALAAAGLTRSFLFGIEPRDLPTILLAVVALTIASFIAAYIPARRASMIDPMAALRHE